MRVSFKLRGDITYTQLPQPIDMLVIIKPDFFSFTWGWEKKIDQRGNSTKCQQKLAHVDVDGFFVLLHSVVPFLCPVILLKSGLFFCSCGTEFMASKHAPKSYKYTTTYINWPLIDHIERMLGRQIFRILIPGMWEIRSARVDFWNRLRGWPDDFPFFLHTICKKRHWVGHTSGFPIFGQDYP